MEFAGGLLGRMFLGLLARHYGLEQADSSGVGQTIVDPTKVPARAMLATLAMICWKRGCCIENPIADFQARINPCSAVVHFSQVDHGYDQPHISAF
jgi:hypothetical protein